MLSSMSSDVQVAILAGGFGTRLAEETDVIPKPMVDVGDRPILWHIMQGYARHGFTSFCIALGYKGEVIKRYFHDYIALGGDLTVSLGEGTVEARGGERMDWTVHLVETGDGTATGGRVKRMNDYLRNGTFMLTYGDGLADLDPNELLAFHRAHGKLATITAVRPPSRFGGIEFHDDDTVAFTEKPQMGEGWINGGFMVFEPGVLDLIDGDETVLEADTLERLADEHQLMAFRHDGFWQCADTLRDLRYLRSLWDEETAPWAKA